jgi:hypothetical protein
MNLSGTYLSMLRRIRAAPIAHLGCRSLELLCAFHNGYSMLAFYRNDSEAESFDPTFRQWIARRYGIESMTLSDTMLLAMIAESDECAFDLFFEELDAALAAHPEGLRRCTPVGREGDPPPLPASGFLDVLSERPTMFLPTLSVRCLRAFLDGYALAAAERGHLECLDLDGFEHWVRQRNGLQGAFRWERVILMSLGGIEEYAFSSAIEELKAYRASQGPLSGRRYEIVRLPPRSDSSPTD